MAPETLSPARRVRRALLDRFRRLLGIQWVIDQIGLVRAELQELNATTARDRPTTRLLAELRAVLDRVEFYQPIFRLGSLPSFAGMGAPKRLCDDRIAAIKTSLGGNLKNVRILDVGSSLGYVSLSLAEDGAIVTGLESLPDNAEAARLISRITGVPAEFLCVRFDDAYVERLGSNRFDAAIFLSVLHHFIEAHGLDHARTTVRALLAKIPVCFFELALKEETGPYSWTDSLPENPLALFEGSGLDLELLGFFPTHLSGVRRPLYRVSAKSVVTVNGRNYPCRRTVSKAYPDSPNMTNRKYHFSDKVVIKEVLAESAESFDGILQTMNEIAVLRTIQRNGHAPVDARVDFPSLVDFEISPQRVLLVLERAPGELLSEAAATLDEAKKLDVLARIESAAIHLAKHHALHHNDLRLWNLIFDRQSDRLTLIDFGLAAPAEGESVRVALAWLAAELDQGRTLSLEARRTLDELRNVPWRSAALRERFEAFRREAVASGAVPAAPAVAQESRGT